MNESQPGAAAAEAPAEKPKANVLDKHSVALNEIRAINPDFADKVAAAIEAHENERVNAPDFEVTGRKLRRHPRVTGITNYAIVKHEGKPAASVSFSVVPDPEDEADEPVDRGTHILVPLA